MVYRQKKAKYSLIAFAVLIVLLLAASAFIEVPFKIKTYAEVFPREKWLLTRGGSGELVSNVIDFVQGHPVQYNISQFQRGEFIAADFSDFLKEGKKEFSKGDTVVIMKSSSVRDELISTQGELEVSLANLKSQSSAQKEPLIREAEHRLKMTEEKLAEQEVLYDRAKKLFDKGFSSQQEFELQKWTRDQLEIERKVNHAQLENLKTGVKPEEIKLLESEVSSIRAKLNFLKERESQLLVKSPIEGTIVASYTPDTLLHVSNFRQVVLHVPVKLQALPEFREGQEFPITFTDIQGKFRGRVIAVGKEVIFLEGQQVVFVSILMDNEIDRLLPGMVLESSVELRKITLLDYILKLVFH